MTFTEIIARAIVFAKASGEWPRLEQQLRDSATCKPKVIAEPKVEDVSPVVQPIQDTEQSDNH